MGVIFLLDPIAAADAPAGPIIPIPLAFAISIAIYIGLFTWIERHVGGPFRAAVIVALSQAALVNVDWVLSGKRGIATAAASSVILFVGWGAVAITYSYLRKD